MRLNQTDFGRLFQLSRQRIHLLETGKSPPRPFEIRRFEARLGKLPTPMPAPRTRQSQKVWRKAFRRRHRWRQPRKVATQVCLTSARESFPGLLEKCECFIPSYRAWLDRMVFDSSYEVALVVQILDANPDCLKVRPLGWGFNAHPICDVETGNALDHAFPALGWTVGETRYILVTQIPLRTAQKPYVVDFLVGILHEGVQRWVVLEVDGPGHLSAGDAVRTERLTIPVVRFRWEDIAIDGRRNLEQRCLQAAFPQSVGRSVATSVA